MKKRMSDKVFLTNSDGQIEVYGRTSVYPTEEEFRKAALDLFDENYGEEAVFVRVRKYYIRINPISPQDQSDLGFSYWVMAPARKARGAWESWAAEMNYK